MEAIAPSKVAIIMRGVAGSGKSTRAKELKGPHGIIHSTDSYFMENGSYVFQPERLEEYHLKNFCAFYESLEKGIPVVICDNTNARIDHFLPYINLAKQKGYEVKVISMPHPDATTAAERNLHHVPVYAIKRTIALFEPY